MSRRSRVPAVLLAAVMLMVAAALAGCSRGDPVQVPEASSPTATSTPSSVSSADSSPGAVAEPAPSGTGPIEQKAAPSPSGALNAAVVKEIRFASHQDFDRVVVEYQGTFGQWRVAYADEILEDPSGEPVPLQGSAFLSVVVNNATFDNLVQVGGAVPHVVYQGPRRIATALPNIREIADAGDFEAVMALGIGLDHVAGLRAYRLEGPSRLVIDVAH